MGRRKNVSYVLLAEFDIDVGTTLSRQLPWPTGVDPQLLAELMLPEGVHDVEQDWTVFMLNQTAENTCEIMIEASSSEEEDDDSDTGSGSKSQPILHVLNLVFRKFDSTAKRKWVVKALAICTHHPYIHIFKPVLLVALQAYFDEPSEACLNRLYEAVTAMDIALAPTLSRYERLIMRQMERRDLFAEKQQQLPAATVATGNPSRSVESFEHTRSRTSSMMSGSTDVDGEAESVDSNHKVGMTLGEKDYRYFYTSIKYASRPPAPPVVLPVKVPLASFPEDVGEYSLVSLIQTFSGPNAQVSGPIHAQLHTNGNLTHPIVVLFNALITQKRVIFLGTRAGQVSEYVLAACALASGCGTVLRGFVERAFPYAHLALCDTVMQNVPGYIAGVTNPIFEQKDWWDLLCNTTTGKMTVHKNINAAPPPLAHFPSVPSTPLPGLPRQDTVGSQDPDDVAGKQAKARDDHPDNVFMEEILLMIQQHHGESNVRQRFTEYVQRFVRMAARYEEEQFRHTDIGFRSAAFSAAAGALGSGVVIPADGAAWAKELNANASRIEGWRKTRSYEYFAADFQTQMEHSQFRTIDITHQLGRLLFVRGVPPAEAEAIARTFAQVCGDGGYEAVVELLAYLPLSRGGLTPLAFGLFSQSETVRASTVELFNRLRNWEVGRVFIRLLNHFQRFAYLRLAAQQQQQLQQQQQQQLPLHASLSAPNIAMARSPSNNSQSSLGH